MVFIITFVHVPPILSTGELMPGIGGLIQGYFHQGIMKSGVPVLSCISGFLLYKSSLDKNLWKLARNKTRSLLIPMLLWNLPVLILIYLLQINGLLTGIKFQAYPLDLMTVLNGVLAINSSPVNGPLFFLRDLYVLALLSPLIGIFLRSAPWLGLLVFFAIGLTNMDGGLVLRNEMLVTFYLGGLAAVRKWDLKRLDHLALPLALLFLAAALIVFLIPELGFWFRILAPLLIWPTAALLVTSSVGEKLVNLSEYSFMLFLSHTLFLGVFSQLYFRILDDPMEHWVMYWFTIPFIVALSAIATYRLAQCWFPNLLAIALGGRTRRSPQQRPTA